MDQWSDKARSDGSAGRGTAPSPQFAAENAVANEIRIVKATVAVELSAASPLLPTLMSQLTVWARSPEIYAVVFSVPSDEASSVAPDPAASLAKAALHLQALWRIECFAKPSASLLDAPLAGPRGELAVGLAAFGTHRVAGRQFCWSLPQWPRQGTLPLAGVACKLARLPAGIGRYLALTGTAIGRADANALGLVTHCIDAESFPVIAAALADCQPIDPLLDDLHTAPDAAALPALHEVIARCFASDKISDIMAALETETGEHRDWASAALLAIQQRPPLVLLGLLRLIRTARTVDTRSSLIETYRLAVGLAASSHLADAAPSEVTIDHLFAIPEGDDLVLPTRAEIERGRAG